MKKLFAACALGFALMSLGCASATNHGRIDQELIQASRTGDEARVSTLISKGADINAVDAEGWTPYLAASAEGNWRVMKLLQSKGCKTDPGF